ncbi:protein tramtrack, beta isoform-like isoform X2 [Centruroides sculpturatus]|uniref:protein tramtrack, beta isoform-like isoform X2 n=1 Tax=Centruroides sculpturatus TaxID=218467 RepID=UPI000C6CC535|nr:protein tramtrack, beta isoform-like isoform X2 [Centruroides sculpturatus]
MGSEQFYVKWNNHQPNMIAVFDQLLTNETFVDVTLACEGVRLKAHKIILSACSSFFQNLFLENPCKHPIVIMKDVKYTELKTVLDFVYKGEIKVTRDQLTGLIKLAKLLNIKGLEEVKDDEQPISNNEAQTTAPNLVSSQQQLVYTFQYVPSPFIPIQPRYNMILHAVEKNEKSNKEKSSSDTNSHNLECHNSKINDSDNEKSTKESSEMNIDSNRKLVVIDDDLNSQSHDDDSSNPSIMHSDVCIKEEKASDDDSNYNEYSNFTDRISEETNVKIKSSLTCHESKGSSHEENSEYMDNSTDDFILPSQTNYLLNKQSELREQDMSDIKPILRFDESTNLPVASFKNNNVFPGISSLPGPSNYSQSSWSVLPQKGDKVILNLLFPPDCCLVGTYPTSLQAVMKIINEGKQRVIKKERKRGKSGERDTS